VADRCVEDAAPAVSCGPTGNCSPWNSSQIVMGGVVIQQPYRLEVLLPQSWRTELADLASSLGVSTADVARLGVGRILRNPTALLGGERSVDRAA
jgi:hypothetical protein